MCLVVFTCRHVEPIQPAYTVPPGYAYASSATSSVMSRKAHSMIAASTPSSFSPTGRAAVNKGFTAPYKGKPPATPPRGSARSWTELGSPHDTDVTSSARQRSAQSMVSASPASDLFDNLSLVPALRPKKSGYSVGAAV